MDFVPEDKVFQIPPEDVAQRHTKAGYALPNPSGLTRSKDGEMLSVFPGFPLPRKGVIYGEAIVANNQVKRITLALLVPFACKEMLLPLLGFALIPFKWKISFLERYLQNYVRLANSVYNSCQRIPYLQKEYYNNLSKGMWEITATILTELGISKETADDVGKVLATNLEYDDAYKLMIEDPLQEFSKDEILMNPQKAIDKFLRIMKSRKNRYNLETKQNENKGNDYKKIEQLAKGLKFLLYIPRIRRAFKKAIEQVNFRWLQLDEIERFWNLGRLDYDVDGRGFEERWAEFQERINAFK